MNDAHRIAMLGTGLIADFYAMALHGQRGRDRIVTTFSRSAARGGAFATRWGIPTSTTSLDEAIGHPEVDVVVVALPNHLHEDAVTRAAAAGKAVLCTKPLARSAEEARNILDTVERAGIFAGYLEDLVYTPKTLKAAAAAYATAFNKSDFAAASDSTVHGLPPATTEWEISVGRMRCT